MKNNRNTFSDFDLDDRILRSIKDMGFEEPTEVQNESIPIGLEGKDLIVQAKTGTGKTAAFSLPVIENLDETGGIQALVLAPTRELACQIRDEIREMSKHTNVNSIAIYGGQKIQHQLKYLQKYQNQIVIATPGRLIDHMKRGTIKLGKIKYLVLDEADRMLDMGFEDDLNWILKRVPNKRQTFVFSATMKDFIKKAERKYMNNPEKIILSSDHDMSADNVEELFYSCPDNKKIKSLKMILNKEEPELCLIFCATRRQTTKLAKMLRKDYGAKHIHGGLKQKQRDRVIDSFRRKDIKFLVATDVAARGIDVDDITHVINYDFPNKPAAYVHRIGRTGRIGKSGKAITLMTNRDRQFISKARRKLNKKMKPTNIEEAYMPKSRQKQEEKEESPPVFV